MCTGPVAPGVAMSFVWPVISGCYTLRISVILIWFSGQKPGESSVLPSHVRRGRDYGSQESYLLPFWAGPVLNEQDQSTRQVFEGEEQSQKFHPMGIRSTLFDLPKLIIACIRRYTNVTQPWIWPHFRDLIRDVNSI